MKANGARDCNSAAPWALKKLAFRMNDGQGNFTGEELRFETPRSRASRIPSTKMNYGRLGFNQVLCFFQCLQVDRKSRKKTEVDVGGDMNNS